MQRRVNTCVSRHVPAAKVQAVSDMALKMCMAVLDVLLPDTLAHAAIDSSVVDAEVERQVDAAMKRVLTMRERMGVRGVDTSADETSVDGESVDARMLRK